MKPIITIITNNTRCDFDVLVIHLKFTLLIIVLCHLFLNYTIQYVILSIEGSNFLRLYVCMFAILKKQ